MKYVIKHLFVTLIFVYVISFCSSSSFLAAEPETDSDLMHGKIVFYEDERTTSSTAKKNNQPTRSIQGPVSDEKKMKKLLPQTSEYFSYVPLVSGLILVFGVLVTCKVKWDVRRI